VNKTYRSQPHFFCPRAIGRADCGRRWYQRAHWALLRSRLRDGRAGFTRAPVFLI